MQKNLFELDILLVEDDPNDVFFFEQACGRVSQLHKLFSLNNARAAIRHLEKFTETAGDDMRGFPTLVVSDLKMPGGDGFELLRWLKNHESCRVVPAIILSSSALQRDVQLAYELGANAYLTKPRSIDELRSLLQKTFEFWCICQHPICPAAPEA